ncbi:MAG TPA: hydrogenase formation protein HypD [Dehalococcoidia bacterium]|nr:hydrogenase formation protein HypD [Dehalococcoidia bacterium]
MSELTSFRQSDMAKGLVDSIKHHAIKEARYMEFCGSHTVAITRNGLRQILPPMLTLVSGPGCPVCVTSNSELDKAIALAKVPGVIVTSFGDMIRVPGSNSNLQEAKANGSDVRIVYSPLDALELAKTNPDKAVVFIAVGFETTAPTVAASVLQAKQEGLKNYYILSLHKICPPVIKALLDSGEVNLQGLICPGHVSAVIGAKAWDFIAADYGIPCVVAGFEPLDILQCIDMLAQQTAKGEAKVEIAYKRSVTYDGNITAQKILEQVFQPCTANWRGMGDVAHSGLKLRTEFAAFDAELKFDFDPGPTKIQRGCICGEVLRGVKTPPDCKLFRKVCTPINPIGPCMVSSEGSCAAYYHYGESNDR